MYAIFEWTQFATDFLEIEYTVLRLFNPNFFPFIKCGKTEGIAPAKHMN